MTAGEQRLAALVRANEVRLARADLRRRLRAMSRDEARRATALLMLAPGDVVAGMPARKLLLACPGVGPARVREWMGPIAPSTPIARLDRERRERIAAHLTAASTRQKENQMKRQGDVLIKPVSRLPKGLKPVPLDQGRVILAYGEVTGHAHAVVGDVEFLAADLAEMEGRFLNVLTEAGADVVHEEHGTVHLEKGLHEVVRQREYTPERIVTVAD